MRRRSLLVLALLLGCSAPARAQWSTTPNPDNIVCGANGAQTAPEAVSDGDGGVISVWNDTRLSGHNDIFAQRLDAGGYAQWPLNGVVVDSTVGILATLVACSDDSNGVIVAWVRLLGTGANRIWVQRVDANGQLRWGAGGVRAGLVELKQDMPRIVRDGSGGALVLWANWQSNSTANIFGQRLSSGGARLWSASGDSVAANGEVRSFEVAERPAGGAYFAWWQTFGLPRMGAIDADRNRLWNGGIVITDAAMSSSPPRLNGAATGDGVIFLCSGGREIYARRTSDAGTPWITPVRVVSGTWFQSQPQIVTDGAGGAIIAWSDSRAFPTTLRAQRLRADGSAAWLVDGEQIASTLGGGFGLHPDGAGGAWFAWGASPGTWAQHYSSAGTPWLAGTGTNLSGSRGLNTDGARLVPTATSGVILVAATSGANSDVWAKRIFGNGSLGTLGVGDGSPAGAGLALSAGPNPARERIALRFVLPRSGHARLELFGLRGERVALLADGLLPAGEHARTWDLGALAPGVYHARLVTEAGATVVRIAHLK